MMLNEFRCPECLHNLIGRINWLIFKSQTSATRAFFGLASLGFSSFMFFSQDTYHKEDEYALMIQMAPDWVWSVGFLLHGFALLYGVLTRQYSTFLLLIEGVLGVALWSAASIAMSISQGAIGASVAGALVSAWICIRYPTHAEFKK